jgi:hypothetical protein
MIKVTDEMLDLMEDWASQDEVNKHSAINYVFKIIGLHEANKPKPEPVAYKVCNPAGCILVESKRQAEKLSSEYGDDTYQALYTAPPLQESLALAQINVIVNDMMPHLTILDLVRTIEHAHGIRI